MEIKTKYKIGDKLYLMYNGCLQLRKVIEINIHIKEKGDTEIKYLMSNNAEYFERNLFATDEDLFNEMKKNIIKD